MASTSVAQPAHPSTPIERIAAKAEAELMRLRAARPALASRIDRAEAIIVMQLGSLNGHRPIRVRLHPDGDHTYLVASGSKLSRRYAVNPNAWSCECPDHIRRHAACKHAISCWVLERAYKAPARPKFGTCDGCGGRFPHRELVEVTEQTDSQYLRLMGVLSVAERAGS